MTFFKTTGNEEGPPGVVASVMTIDSPDIFSSCCLLLIENQAGDAAIIFYRSSLAGRSFSPFGILCTMF